MTGCLLCFIFMPKPAADVAPLPATALAAWLNPLAQVLKAIPVPSRVYTRFRDAPPHHHHHLLPSPATAAPASSAHAAAAGAAPAGTHADGLDGTQASGAAVGTAGIASPALAGGLGTAGSAASPMPMDTPMLASAAPSPAAVPGWPGGVGTPVLSPGSHPAAAATAHYDPAHAAHATLGMPSRMLQPSEAGTAVAGVGGVGASRDISHELEEVVAWCRARMQWEQLLLQFQVSCLSALPRKMNMGFSEGRRVVTLHALAALGTPCEARLQTVGSLALRCAPPPCPVSL